MFMLSAHYRSPINFSREHDRRQANASLTAAVYRPGSALTFLLKNAPGKPVTDQRRP